MKRILLMAILSCLFCGCNDNIPQPQRLNPPTSTDAHMRFQMLSLEEHNKDMVGNVNALTVYKDNLTGIEYLVVNSPRGIAIIKLEIINLKKGE